MTSVQTMTTSFPHSNRRGVHHLPPTKNPHYQQQQQQQQQQHPNTQPRRRSREIAAATTTAVSKSSTSQKGGNNTRTAAEGITGTDSSGGGGIGETTRPRGQKPAVVSPNQNDSNIIRGAEILRSHIRKYMWGKVERESNHTPAAVDAASSSNHLGNNHKQEHDNLVHKLSYDDDQFSSSDNFSEIWADYGINITSITPVLSGSTPIQTTSTTPGTTARGASSKLNRNSVLVENDVDDDDNVTPWTNLSTVLEEGESDLSPSLRPSTSGETAMSPTTTESVQNTVDTPVTFMGRDRKLKTKSQTYLVESLEYSEDDATYSFIDNDYEDLDGDDRNDSSFDSSPRNSGYMLPKQLESSMPTKQQQQQQQHGNSVPSKQQIATKPSATPWKQLVRTPTGVSPDWGSRNLDEKETARRQSPPSVTDLTVHHPSNGVLDRSTMSLSDNSSKSSISMAGLASPLSVEYGLLILDPAYRHAQRAGFLWQSLVGQQVRFPSQWWSGSRAPPMGDLISPWEGLRRWQYLGRYPVRGHKFLNKLVRNRSAPGRLLLHIIVQDLITLSPAQDIVIGCFHPTARGIRQTSMAAPELDANRDLWIAVRKRCDNNISVMENFLDPTTVEYSKNPLGTRQRITNDNVRAIYGERPPLETMFVVESELYERLSSSILISQDASPALALLEEFVFS